MVELVELDERHQEFAQRNVRVVAISNDDQEAARKTQAKFKHLVIIADTEQKLAKAVAVVHAGVGPGGTDTNAPTTILLDGAGNVRWLFRPDRFVTRIPADKLLAEIDKSLARK